MTKPRIVCPCGSTRFHKEVAPDRVGDVVDNRFFARGDPAGGTTSTVNKPNGETKMKQDKLTPTKAEAERMFKLIDRIRMDFVYQTVMVLAVMLLLTLLFALLLEVKPEPAQPAAPVAPPASPTHVRIHAEPEEGMWIEDTTSDTVIGLSDHSRHVKRLEPPERIDK